MTHLIIIIISFPPSLNPSGEKAERGTSFNNLLPLSWFHCCQVGGVSLCPVPISSNMVMPHVVLISSKHPSPPQSGSLHLHLGMSPYCAYLSFYHIVLLNCCLWSWSEITISTSHPHNIFTIRSGIGVLEYLRIQVRVLKLEYWNMKILWLRAPSPWIL